MLLLTDRPSYGLRIQRILQAIGPCSIAAVHHAPVQTPVFTSIICDVKLDLPGALTITMAALGRYRTRPDIPVLFLLRDPSFLTRDQARLAGATIVMDYPVADALLLAAASELVQRGNAAPLLDRAAQKTRAAAKDVAASLAKAFQTGAKRHPINLRQIKSGAETLLGALRQATMRDWLDVVWSYDDTTYQHCLLVAGLSAAFGMELALPPGSQQLLVEAALLHDIGKARIPVEILNKPGKLTLAEMTLMRTHALIGFEMLIQEPNINPVILDVARHHHELLDGTGYPDRLSDAEISRPVRMLTICDIYAALVERRPYKNPHPPKAALIQLDSMGAKLDRPLVHAFRNVVIDGEPALAYAR